MPFSKNAGLGENSCFEPRGPFGCSPCLHLHTLQNLFLGSMKAAAYTTNLPLLLAGASVHEHVNHTQSRAANAPSQIQFPKKNTEMLKGPSKRMVAKKQQDTRERKAWFGADLRKGEWQMESEQNEKVWMWNRKLSCNMGSRVKSSLHGLKWGDVHQRGFCQSTAYTKQNNHSSEFPCSVPRGTL